MCVIITQIQKLDASPMGWRKYQLNINSETITTYEHRRGDGLAACLRAAADAVERNDDQRTLKLIEACMPNDGLSQLADKKLTNE